MRRSSTAGVLVLGAAVGMLLSLCAGRPSRGCGRPTGSAVLPVVIGRLVDASTPAVIPTAGLVCHRGAQRDRRSRAIAR